MTIELTEQQEDEIRSRLFKAISEPIRLEIIRFLVKCDKEVNCGEIGDHINLTKSAASYHFKILREAGLTVTHKSSREKYVSINREYFDLYLKGFLDSL